MNLEFFARYLFSGNLAFAKFSKNKSSLKGEIFLSFTDICKSSPSREF